MKPVLDASCDDDLANVHALLVASFQSAKSITSLRQQIPRRNVLNETAMHYVQYHTHHYYKVYHSLLWGTVHMSCNGLPICYHSPRVYFSVSGNATGFP